MSIKSFLPCWLIATKLYVMTQVKSDTRELRQFLWPVVLELIRQSREAIGSHWKVEISTTISTKRNLSESDKSLTSLQVICGSAVDLSTLMIYVYIYIYHCEHSNRDTLINTQYFKLRIKDKWSSPRKGVVLSPTPRFSCYWQGSLWVAHLTYLYMKVNMDKIRQNEGSRKNIIQIGEYIIVKSQR